MKQRLAFLLLSAAVLAGCFAAFSAPKPSSPVYTNWSQLTDYEPPEALYGIFSPFSGDSLTERDDYGVLLPYMGAVNNLDEYIMDQLPLYGLMTADGEIITDPVYADIHRMADYHSAVPAYAPFLILSAGNPENSSYPGDSYFSSTRITVAALDGSWIVEGDYCSAEMVDSDHLALIGRDSSVTVIDETGTTVSYFPRDIFTPHLGEDYYWASDGGPLLQWLNGVGCVWVNGDYEKSPGTYQFSLYLDIASGTVSREPPAGFSKEVAYSSWQESPSFPGYNYADPETDPVTGLTYFYAHRDDETWTYDMLDETGSVLLADCGSPYFFYPWVWNGLIATVRNSAFCYFDLNGDCVFRYPLRTNSD